MRGVTGRSATMERERKVPHRPARGRRPVRPHDRRLRSGARQGLLRHLAVDNQSWTSERRASRLAKVSAASQQCCASHERSDIVLVLQFSHYCAEFGMKIAHRRGLPQSKLGRKAVGAPVAIVHLHSDELLERGLNHNCANRLKSAAVWRYYSGVAAAKSGGFAWVLGRNVRSPSAHFQSQFSRT